MLKHVVGFNHSASQKFRSPISLKWRNCKSTQELELNNSGSVIKRPKDPIKAIAREIRRAFRSATSQQLPKSFCFYSSRLVHSRMNVPGSLLFVEGYERQGHSPAFKVCKQTLSVSSLGRGLTPSIPNERQRQLRFSNSRHYSKKGNRNKKRGKGYWGVKAISAALFSFSSRSKSTISKQLLVSLLTIGLHFPVRTNISG